jgi:hypothetical protein
MVLPEQADSRDIILRRRSGFVHIEIEAADSIGNILGERVESYFSFVLKAFRIGRKYTFIKEEVL